MAGLTVKELFLEFGITENDDTQSPEGPPTLPSATNPLVHSNHLASVREIESHVEMKFLKSVVVVVVHCRVGGETVALSL